MPQNKYKYVSIVLAITTIVFAALYFSKSDPNLTGIYGSISDKVKECNDAVTEWNTKYAGVASSTDKQEALDAILKDCREVVGEGQGQLQ